MAGTRHIPTQKLSHTQKTIVFNQTFQVSCVTFCGERNAIPCFFKPVFMTREERRGVGIRSGWVVGQRRDSWCQPSRELKTRLIPRTGRSFKDKLSESNSLALSCDAQSDGGDEEEQADSEESHNHLYIFFGAGTVARLTIRPLSHLYLFCAAEQQLRQLRFPPLVAASPSFVIIQYALHIVGRLLTTTGCSVLFFSFLCLTENIWKTPSWIDDSWISARVRHDLRRQNAHLHPFSPLEGFFSSLTFVARSIRMLSRPPHSL